MTKPAAAVVLVLIVGTPIAVIAYAVHSFRDYSDQSDAEAFRKDGSECQIRARMYGEPVVTRSTKYGPACAK